MERLSDAQLRATANAYKANGKNKQATARELGLDPKTVRRRLSVCAEKGLLGFSPVLPGFELKQSTDQRDGDGNVEKQWIKQHKESGPAFEMPAGQVLRGVSAFVDAEGRIRHQWIKTKNDSAAPAMIEALKAEFKDYRGRAKIVPVPRRVDRMLLNVLPIADPHIGMLSWTPQTGAPYDLKIATERLCDKASDLLSRAPRARQAALVNLGDWYHANDQRNVTPKSQHQLDVDGRWFKVLRAGVRTFRAIIDMALAKHERVEVINIPGNHDPEASGALALALAEFHERNRRVSVAFPADIYYRRFGVTLFGAAHGDKAPPSRLAMAMAVDQREAWGATAYHWLMYGHIHQEKLTTVGDVRVESFSTVADKDAHAFAGAWRNSQALSVITLHKREGEVMRQRVNIPPPVDALTRNPHAATAATITRAASPRRAHAPPVRSAGRLRGRL